MALPPPTATRAAPWLIAMVAATLVAWVLWRRDPGVVAEHHVIENAQTALLLVACLISGFRASRPAHMLDTLGRMALALLCLSFAVRETDIDQLGASAAWPVIEGVVRAAVVAGWVAFTVFAVRRLHGATGWREALCSSASWLTAAAAALYAISQLFDQQVIPIEPATSMFIEEAIQLNGCLLFLAAAASRRIRAEGVNPPGAPSRGSPHGSDHAGRRPHKGPSPSRLRGID